MGSIYWVLACTAILAITATAESAAGPSGGKSNSAGKSTYIRSHSAKSGSQIGGHYEQRGNWGKPKSTTSTAKSRNRK